MQAGEPTAAPKLSPQREARSPNPCVHPKGLCLKRTKCPTPILLGEGAPLEKSLEMNNISPLSKAVGAYRSGQQSTELPQSMTKSSR